MREIYADNAASTPMCGAAADIMIQASKEIYGNPSGLHRSGQRAAGLLREARNTMAECMGVLPEELIFTSGGTESDNQAVRSAACLGARAGRRHLISTGIEHRAVLNPLRQLEREGFSVNLLSPDREGFVGASRVKAAIRPDTALVSVMYANNEIGTIEPVSGIGAVCREAGVLFHTDAVQAAGHLPIKPKEESIDLLSLSAHKFHGPKGVGALYVRNGIGLLPLIDGGGQEGGRRSGTENVPGIAAMAAAFREACLKMEENRRKIGMLRDALEEGLLKIPGTVINGSRNKRLPGNLSIRFEGIEGESLLLLLDSRGICASSGSACSRGSGEPSHVLTAIGLSGEEAAGTLRFSLDAQNTMEEIREIIRVTAECASLLRNLRDP